MSRKHAVFKLNMILFFGITCVIDFYVILAYDLLKDFHGNYIVLHFGLPFAQFQLSCLGYQRWSSVQAQGTCGYLLAIFQKYG